MICDKWANAINRSIAPGFFAPGIEGGIRNTLLDLFGVVSVSQSDKSVDFKTVGAIASDHLPNS